MSLTRLPLMMMMMMKFAGRARYWWPGGDAAVMMEEKEIGRQVTCLRRVIHHGSLTQRPS
jgi:hypothetical protein